MYEQDKKLLKRKLKRLVRNGRLLKKKNVYFFGINDRTRETIILLDKMGVQVKGIIENDKRKIGLHCRGIRAISITDIPKIEDRSNIYLLHSSFWREMEAQLIAEGAGRRQIIKLFTLNRMNETWLFRIRNILGGKRIYRRIKEEYGEKTKVLLCPYTGTGDIYLIGTMLREYLEREQIKKYVFLVVSTACARAAALFNIKNVEKLWDIGEASLLIEYYLFCPNECDITILNDGWPQVYTNHTEWIRGLHGLDFTQMFRRYVFSLPEDIRLVRPIYRRDNAQVEAMMKACHLPYGKTIILAPYSNTLADIPMIFWERLAKELTDRGYAVCTNCGSEEEEAIKGTKAVRCLLNLVPQFVEAAGGFIGVRSGLCDVISAADAKKVILYDADNYFYNSKAIDYFSLNRMGICDNADEIEFFHGNMEKTIKEIFKRL